MECDICLLQWDFQRKIPRLLSCGHTFCEECLQSILEKSISNKEIFSCPTCKSKQKIESSSDIRNLIKNYNLLRVIEKIESRKNNFGKNSSILLDDSNINCSSLNNPGEASSFLDDSIFQFKCEQQYRPALLSAVQKRASLKKNFEIEGEKLIKSQNVGDDSKKNDIFSLDFDQKCPKHDLPITCYAPGTYELFCEDCLCDTELKTLPLPFVIEEIKRKIDQNLVKACLTKNEIEKIEAFFVNFLSEFEKMNKNKIESIFNHIYKVINFLHNQANQVLQQCVAEQKTRVNERITQLHKLNQELSQIETDLINIRKMKEIQMYQNLSNIQRIQHKLSNFINYNLEFDLFSMDIGFKPHMKDNFSSLLRETYNLEVEFFEINHQPPSIKKILSIGEYWPCICGEICNDFNAVKCASCGLFRKYETIMNALNKENPDVSLEDISTIEMIKKTMAKDFKNLIKNNNNSQRFYALNSEWFLRWKCFVLNDTTDKILSNERKKVSSNKLIGVLPPGPICNDKLIMWEDNGELKLNEGMLENVHYVIVSEPVWEFFYLNFNGGPSLILNKNENIYDSFRGSNKIEYRSYSQIKGEFVDEISYDKKISDVSDEVEDFPYSNRVDTLNEFGD